MDEVDYCYVPEGVSLPALISDTLVFEDEETQADDEDLEEQQVSSQLFQLNGVPTNEENNPLQLSDRTRTCKDDAPCQICEGDCDQGNKYRVYLCSPPRIPNFISHFHRAVHCGGDESITST